MGHIVLSESLGGNPKKLRAINYMPPQNNKQGVERILGMVNREEKCDVTLPWQKNVWTTTMESLTNDAGEVEENWKKAIGLYLQNNNSARASRFSVRFLAVVA